MSTLYRPQSLRFVRDVGHPPLSPQHISAAARRPLSHLHGKSSRAPARRRGGRHTRVHYQSGTVLVTNSAWKTAKQAVFAVDRLLPWKAMRNVAFVAIRPRRVKQRARSGIVRYPFPVDSAPHYYSTCFRGNPLGVRIVDPRGPHGSARSVGTAASRKTSGWGTLAGAGACPRFAVGAVYDCGRRRRPRPIRLPVQPLSRRFQILLPLPPLFPSSKTCRKPLIL